MKRYIISESMMMRILNMLRESSAYLENQGYESAQMLNVDMHVLINEINNKYVKVKNYDNSNTSISGNKTKKGIS